MLDATYSRLLAELQTNAVLTSQELGEILCLSPSQAARRRKRLEQEGFVKGCSARLAPEKIGLTVQACMQGQINLHSPDAARGFSALVASCPKVVSARTLTGEADYLPRVCRADLVDLNRLIHEVCCPIRLSRGFKARSCWINSR